VGHSIRQGVVGMRFALMSKYLGDQWSVGDYEGLQAALATELPVGASRGNAGSSAEPAQNIKEYDPEWARVFWTGTVNANCDHAAMLAQVKCPVLLTHHFRLVNDEGWLIGAMSDLQAQRAVSLVQGAGQPVTYQSFPQMGHSMHGQDPELFAATLTAWAKELPAGG
jgi:pimeloyl-ACP methyl ester carboxylesterase